MMNSHRLALLCLSCLIAIGAFAGFAGAASAAPFNDNFADAELVKGTNFGTSTSLNSATREPSEPTIAGSDTDHTVWQRWVAPSNGFLRVSTRISADNDNGLADVALGLYTGSSVAALTPLAQASGSCVALGSIVQTDAVPVVGGATYYIQMGNASSVDISSAYSEYDFATTLPANDDWEDATELPAALPQSIDASNRLAINSNETTLNASFKGRNSIWYSWTPGQSGTVAIDTCSTAAYFLDTTIELFDDGGAPPASLGTLVEAAANDDGCNKPGNMSLIETAVTAGTKYWIRVGNWGNFYGSDITLTLRWLTSFENFNPPTLSTVSLYPTDSVSAREGDWWSTNTIAYTYQWQRCDAAGANCAEIAGETNSQYQTTAEDIGQTLRIAVTGNDGVDSITAYSATSLPISTGAANDAIADATDLGSSNVVNQTHDNQFTGLEGGEYDAVPYPIDSTVWFKWTAPGSGSATIGTCRGSDAALTRPLRAMIGVHTGYDGNGVDNLTRVAAAKENCGAGDFGASVQFNATAGTTYWIQVGSSDGYSGQFRLKINAPAASAAPGTPPAATPPVATPVDPFPTPTLAKLGTIKVKKGKVSLNKLNLACGATATGPCTGALTIKTAKKKVNGKTVKPVSQSFKLSVKPGAKAGTTFKLNKKMLAAIKKAKSLKAAVTVKLGAPGFSQKSARTSATLKR